MVKFNVYFLVASCKATTFTKVDQVEEKKCESRLTSKLYTSFFKNGEN